MGRARALRQLRIVTQPRPERPKEKTMTERRSYLIPNAIVGLRVAMAFAAAGLMVVGSATAAVVGVVLTLAAIAMDALDGIVARRMGLASKLGGILDITADRIVEHAYWITFAVAQLVPLWIPLVVVTRSLLVDGVRGLALAQGKTAFGETSMARSRLSRFLTASRLMRSLYGVAKLAAFVLLGSVIAMKGLTSATAHAFLTNAATACALVAVGLCVVRGIPVLAEAAAYVRPETAR
jgi:CDP-diacylglycerol--glycerol-3-phosphate 3-phosphatidyltransferase